MGCVDIYSIKFTVYRAGDYCEIHYLHVGNNGKTKATKGGYLCLRICERSRSVFQARKQNIVVRNKVSRQQEV